LKFRNELLPRIRADRALRLLLFDGVGRLVVRDHAVAALHETQDHVAAHAAQADHPHLHVTPLPNPLPCGERGTHYLTADLTDAASAFQPAAASLPSVTRSTGRRRDVSDSRSPSDCACLR